jgi:hypothetical protein
VITLTLDDNEWALLGRLDERTKNTHELVKGMRDEIDTNRDDINNLKVAMEGKKSDKKRRFRKLNELTFADVMKICIAFVIGVSTIIGAVVAT